MVELRDTETTPDPTRLRASVVIPTWNGADRITNALVSLVDQTVPSDEYEIVVVDDGSLDHTADMVSGLAAQHRDHRVRCIRRAHEGVNAARNAGIRATQGEIIVLIDDDEVVEPGYLQRVLDMLDDPAMSTYAGVGGPARATGSEHLRTCGDCSIGEAVLPIDGAGATKRLLGGNMAVRRQVFDEVGLFDPEISGRGDETEWFARADRIFYYDEELVVSHRRDHLTVRGLLVIGFRQGRSVPLLHQRLGTPWRPSLVRLTRYTGHAVRRRCVNGLLQASREAGSTIGWIVLSVPRTGRLRRKARTESGD